LDSDGSFNLLLPDRTSIASWNFGRCDLEHVDHSVSETGRLFRRRSGGPHARVDGIDKPTLAFGRSEEGVALGAANQRAEIFFLAISPSQTPRMQAYFLVSIARLIGSEYVLMRLRYAKTLEELIGTIRAGEQVLPP
jgi:hypothetical protein